MLGVWLILVLFTYLSHAEYFGSLSPPSTCTGPRIRRAWVDLSLDEKRNYMNVVSKMKIYNITMRSDKPSTGYSPNTSLYNYFVDIHSQSLNARDWHGTSFFLVAHRYFLWKYESALQYIARLFGSTFTPPITDPCSITVPYWSWELDYENNTKDNYLPQNNSAIFNPPEFFGPPPNPNATTFDVPYGRFSAPDWVTTFATNQYGDANYYTKPTVQPLTFTLKRWFSNAVVLSYGPSQIMQGIVNNIAYTKYCAWIEGPHSGPHRWFAFQMQSMNSPDDPLFFSHHCNIDRLFAIWQDCNEYENFNTSTINSTLYSNITKYDSYGNPYYDYSIDSPIPFYWKPSKDSFAIPKATFPTPRQVYFMGNEGAPSYDGMYYRYGPDTLIQGLSTDSAGNPFCPRNIAWTLVNQPLPVVSKKRFDFNFTLPKYNTSDLWKLDTLKSLLAKAIELGKLGPSALDYIANVECLSTPQLDIDDNVEAWMNAQGALLTQYDRSCDLASVRYCRKSKNKNKVQCRAFYAGEQEGLSTTLRNVPEWIILVAVISTILLLVSIGVVIFLVTRQPEEPAVDKEIETYVILPTDVGGSD